MAIDHLRARDIFLAAVEQSDETQRDAFLTEACTNDEKLRHQVNRLIDAHSQTGSFLEEGAFADPTVDLPVTEILGTRIGPYKLREQIGEGGFGIVFVAEQDQPVFRKVALKMIKPGMDSKDIVARFEAERQALAMMDHPNVAKVLDAGATESGRPYFVMELVHGVLITEFCDEQQLSNRQRLELFVDVCRAVQHAHQKGIIHRDLKPSNILVTMSDDKPMPKVIDFGIAKALHHRLTDKSVYTGFGQMVGTPTYMSPEQAQMSAHDVDTRSDIYSLGVLLYELLTGTAPFDKETFKGADFDEIRRIIREDEPPRPSDRVSTLNAELQSTVSAQRRVDRRALSQSLCGDLDWIVMKTLEKDRTRRYETANALAADVQRFLNDEPVLACPPSTLYRFRKFAIRNRGALIAATAIGITLVLGMFTTTWQAIRASTALGEKTIALNEKTIALEESQASWERESIMTNLVLGEIVSFARPESGNPDATVRGALLSVEKKMDLERVSDARLEGWLRYNIAGYFFDMGEYLAAKRNYIRAYELRLEIFGSDAKQTLTTANQLSALYSKLGEHDQAVAMARELSETHSRLSGEEGEPAVKARHSLGISLLHARRFKEAEEILTRTIEDARRLGLDETEASAIHNLGSVYFHTEKDDKAEQYWTTALESFRRINGDHDASLIKTTKMLTDLLLRKGRFVEAERALSELLPKVETIYSADHPINISVVYSLAWSHYRLRNFEKAAKFYRRVYAANRDRFGEDNVKTLEPMHDLALALGYVDSKESKKLHEQAVEIAKRLWGAQNKQTLFYLNGLGNAASGLHDYETASECFREIIDARQTLRSEKPGDNQNALMLGGAFCNLGIAYIEQRKNREAVESCTDAIDVLEPLSKTSSRLTTGRFLSYSYGARASARYYLGQYEQSLADLQKALVVADTDRRKAYLELMRAQTVAAQGNYADVIQGAIGVFEEFEDDGELAYELAAVYAIAANVAAKDQSNGSGLQTELVTEYVDNCFETLELAKNLSHFDLVSSVLDLKTEPNFASIRNDPQYGPFVESLSRPDKKKIDSESQPTSGGNREKSH